MRLVTIAIACALLVACGPSLKGEMIAGRTVMITNSEDQPVTIHKIVANDSAGRAECVDSPGATLGPGRTYTITFFYCDEVKEVDVETDQGSRALSLG